MPQLADMLKALAWPARVSLAAEGDLDEHAMALLASDREPAVRMALATRGDLTDGVRGMLAADPNPWVAAMTPHGIRVEDENGAMFSAAV